MPESAELQLALCEDEKVAKAVCSFSDDSDPKAPIPRRFQNAILAVTATPFALNAAIEKAQRLLAAEAIERDHKTGELGKLVREQLKRIIPELQKQFRVQTCRAFDRVVFAGGTSYPIEEQFQVPEEQILQRSHGQSSLRKFLDTKNLIYQPGDALDVGRFLRDILPGATPLPDKAGVYTARAIHERFLGASGLRLVPDGGVVRQTILKALGEGKLVVRLADGRAYDSEGCVEGSEGRRRRVSGNLTTLALDADVWIAPRTNYFGQEWLKEIKEEQLEDGKDIIPPSPPRPPERITATTWEKVLEYSSDRPLLKLQLVAHSPAAGASLLNLALPLGADNLSLSVNVGGRLKEGGTINFAANDLKPTHPTKPLAIAQTLYNALGESVNYEAELALNFGSAGRTGLETQLRTLSENAPEEISPQATFDKPIGGKK